VEKQKFLNCVTVSRGAGQQIPRHKRKLKYQ